ncbi:hypothetical protein DPMN_061937 [Dreissena polymorpha]|uniref:Uncharacterized protein n=1 Tax=Dreissena polymorpha TaxID=45954 RepID=A0A9D4HJN8_DREPO|nr:hypothetical protein DPMN_061937 [Dreissena polymorpha]
MVALLPQAKAQCPCKLKCDYNEFDAGWCSYENQIKKCFPGIRRYKVPSALYCKQSSPPVSDMHTYRQIKTQWPQTQKQCS